MLGHEVEALAKKTILQQLNLDKFKIFKNLLGKNIYSDS